MTTTPRSLGWLATVQVSTGQSLARLWRLRWRVPVLALLVVLGVFAFAAGALASDRFQGRMLYCLLSWWLATSVVVPWATLFLAVQLVHGTIEDRTFQYLFLRPVGRTPLLLGHFLAVAIAAAVFAVALAWVPWFALTLHPERWPDGTDPTLAPGFTLANAASAVAYAGVGVLFAVAFRRPLVWAAFFVVGLQMLTANLPVSAGLRAFTITDPVRRLLFDRIEPDARLGDALWPAEQQLSDARIGSPLFDLAVFTGVALALAAFVYRRTEYDGRHRE